MEDYLAALDGWLAELDAWKAEMEAKFAEDDADETPPEQPPLPDSPTDPA